MGKVRFCISSFCFCCDKTHDQNSLKNKGVKEGKARRGEEGRRKGQGRVYLGLQFESSSS